MSPFRRHFGTIFLAVLLLLIPVSWYWRGPEITSRGPATWFDHVVFSVVAPILRGSRALKEGVSVVFHRYLFLIRTARDNEELRRLVHEIKKKDAFFEVVAEENRRLARLLEFKESLPFETTAARVLGYPPLGEFRMLLIDRGKEEGVRRGAPVIASEGLVGRVVRIEDHLAQVLLLTDPTSAVDCRVKRTGARGLVVGYGADVGLKRELFIGASEFWNASQEVQEDDLLVTSGLDDVFPPNVPVGTVKEIRKGKHDVFQEGKVIPTVDLNKLREVLVLRIP